MRVRLANTAGFCYGVRRAVDMAERAASQGPVFLLGHITHNDQVIRALEDLGAVTIRSPEEAPVESTVLIRAHGEPDAVYRALEERAA